MTDAIAPARPAAIILLLRDGEDGDDPLEVLCLQRSTELGAFSGVLSFPGGKVSEADADPALRARCDGADGLDDEAFGHAVAAIREAFEEAGVLFARRAGGDAPIGDNLIGDAWATSHEDERRRLADGTLPTTDFVQTHDIRLALDRLTLFARWITPEFQRHRFDTWFFAAHAPEGHTPSHDGGEIVEGLWIAPDAALAEADAGRRSIVFPTRLTLMRLAQYASAEAAIAGVRDWPMDPIMPVRRDTSDGIRLCIPPETGYPVCEVPVEVASGKAPWRS
jgi:8-oxo-dGTP pyrophosphatase MutT (NUDIX family)